MLFPLPCIQEVTIPFMVIRCLTALSYFQHRSKGLGLSLISTAIEVNNISSHRVSSSSVAEASSSPPIGDGDQLQWQIQRGWGWGGGDGAPWIPLSQNDFIFLGNCKNMWVNWSSRLKITDPYMYSTKLTETHYVVVKVTTVQKTRIIEVSLGPLWVMYDTLMSLICCQSK